MNLLQFILIMSHNMACHIILLSFKGIVVAAMHPRFPCNFLPVLLPVPAPVLTALPLRVAEFKVSAGAGRVLLGTVWAAQVLDLVVQGLESGVNLHVVLPEGAGGLVGPHVPQGIRGLLRLRQASESRHVDARARWAGGPRGSSVTRRTLKMAEGRGGVTR